MTHLLDVADSQMHEGLQGRIQPAVPCGQVGQVSPHPRKTVESCGDVDSVEILTGIFDNVKHRHNAFSIHNAPVDVSVQVCDWL